jgi:hypothetical protein
MAHTYLKQRSVGTEEADREVTDNVREMIAGSRERGEAEASALARRFDGWDGPNVGADSMGAPR